MPIPQGNLPDKQKKAKDRVLEELNALTQSNLDRSIVESAWQRLTLTDQVDVPGLDQFVRDAQAADLLDRVPPIADILYKENP